MGEREKFCLRRIFQMLQEGYEDNEEGERGRGRERDYEKSNNLCKILFLLLVFKMTNKKNVAQLAKH